MEWREGEKKRGRLGKRVCDGSAALWPFYKMEGRVAERSAD